MGFGDTNFRNSRLNRLRVLEDHVEYGRLSEKLFWRDRGVRRTV